ncbi:MAG: LysR family transcriptional regulator [Lachnospiraceae bacterium]|nr:LysR family transcriptional regulator [Candidatus Equihabitans merdae]
MDDRFEVRVKVAIKGETAFFGPGIADLMRHIDKTGSVKEGCQSMGLSYSKGWSILNRAEKELGYPLIRRNHGGREGGGAAITDQGRELLAKFDQMHERIAAYAEEVYAEIFE